MNRSRFVAIGTLSALQRSVPLIVIFLAFGAGRTGAPFTESESAGAPTHPPGGSPEFRVATVSSRSDMVSGGDVLVRIDIVPEIELTAVVVERNGADVSSSFRPSHDGHALLGLVTGLTLGKNQLVVRGRERASLRTELVVINHPIAGPIISGPHEQPYFCTTQLFKLVTGALLGPALGPDCSVPTRVDYVYRSTAGTMKPLPELGKRPADLQFTSTIDGRTVPYIVRVETGTINRAIYETAILHDPTQAEPSPWVPNDAWNKRLIYRFGGGCREGWFAQGTSTGGVLDDVQLSRGYALASASLNVFGNNCSDLLAAETMMMVKERFTERYGPPRFTIGWGSSGGSHQQHGIGDNYPGLLDGLVVGASFPDVTSGTISKMMDSRLLEHYFGEIAPNALTKEQQLAVAGFGVLTTLRVLSDGANRIDPDSEFPAVVPREVRYNAVTNPRGARATVWDHAANVYGRDPATGFARRPLDNVGVQYGLGPLNKASITPEQFLDLNERIGGLDIDANYQPQRTEGDPAALRAAYQSGRIVSGRDGLASVPIVDFRSYRDLAPGGDNHERFHSFSTRARLTRANGHADNHVILVRDVRFGFGFGSAFSSSQTNEVLYEALAQIDRWLVGIESDLSGDPQGVKVVRAKPGDLVDACWTPEGEKIAERQTYDGKGRCNELYPSFPVPRMVAGAPLADDVVKCQLKPIDLADYAVKFDAAQQARLRRIFPTGVCDWSKPGVGQLPRPGTWQRFGT